MTEKVNPKKESPIFQKQNTVCRIVQDSDTEYVGVRLILAREVDNMWRLQQPRMRWYLGKELYSPRRYLQPVQPVLLGVTAVRDSRSMRLAQLHSSLVDPRRRSPSREVKGPDGAPNDLKSMKFKVGMKWSPDLKMKVKVMKKDTLFSEEVYSPNDEECGYLLERTFEVFNREPHLTAYVSIGTENDVARDHCLNLMCKKFPLHVDSQPSPSPIKLTHSPGEIKVGEPGTVECSTKDENLATEMSIRIVDYRTAKPLMVVKGNKLVMEASMGGRYECMGRSGSNGEIKVVVSDQALDVVPLPDPDLDLVASYKVKRDAMMDTTTMMDKSNIEAYRDSFRKRFNGVNSVHTGWPAALLVCALLHTARLSLTE
ncbi:hypothetical protein RRG08_054482 [Elysia crispata]|uniref:Uncharacterized protein n=1 Tax=Elysia crispata TaxID=231223 RepID=A0AAE0Y712_9GAST|nr:hypothetical protein RRG08_054482 [Elysia crispata]